MKRSTMRLRRWPKYLWKSIQIQKMFTLHELSPNFGRAWCLLSMEKSIQLVSISTRLRNSLLLQLFTLLTLPFIAESSVFISKKDSRLSNKTSWTGLLAKLLPSFPWTMKATTFDSQVKTLKEAPFHKDIWTWLIKRLNKPSTLSIFSPSSIQAEETWKSSTVP